MILIGTLSSSEFLNVFPGNLHSGEGGGGVEILLAAPCYRNKPDITTVLKGRLTCTQILLCKIIVRLKIPHLIFIEVVIFPKLQVHH